MRRATVDFYEFLVLFTIIMILAGMMKPLWAGYYEEEIANMYQRGNMFVKADKEKARKWYRLSREECAKYGI